MQTLFSLQTCTRFWDHSRASKQILLSFQARCNHFLTLPGCLCHSNIFSSSTVGPLITGTGIPVYPGSSPYEVLYWGATAQPSDARPARWGFHRATRDHQTWHCPAQPQREKSCPLPPRPTWEHVCNRSRAGLGLSSCLAGWQ